MDMYNKIYDKIQEDYLSGIISYDNACIINEAAYKKYNKNKSRTPKVSSEVRNTINEELDKGTPYELIANKVNLSMYELMQILNKRY